MKRFTTVLFAGLLTLTPLSHADESFSLDSPAGGWSSPLTEKLDEAGVAYPNPPIDRGPQSGRTLIQGHLKAAGPHRAGTLVVNGNPMPLYADEEGRFARPYVFGPGSNSIEVRAPDGQVRRRVQFYHTGDGGRVGLRVILSWDDSQAEVDLHILTPDGQHAFFADPRLKGGGGLDVDSVDGAGPEMFSVAAPLHGAYQVYVNYWGHYDAGGYHFDERTRERPIITTRVTVIRNENTPEEKREDLVVPLRKIGELTYVKTVFM